MIDTKIIVDDREFQQALTQLIDMSSRDMASVVAGKCADFALEAIRHTRKASADAIAIKLGKIGNKLAVDRKTGKLKRGRQNIYKQDSLAERILRKRDRLAGRPYMAEKEMEPRVRKFIANRLRAVGFVKSGWLPVYRKMLGAVRDKGDSSASAAVLAGIRQYGKPKGRAIPPRYGVPAPTGFMEISSMGDPFSNRAVWVAEDGARKAAAAVLRQMKDRIAMKLEQRAKQFSGR